MKSTNSSLTIYIDGACKGNPGKSGVGMVIYDENGNKIKEISKSIGITTNNVAEYTAFIFALQEALFIGCREVTVYTDSELLCRQIKGQYKVKNNNLKILFNIAKNLISRYESFYIENIPRESNKIADKLASKSIT